MTASNLARPRPSLSWVAAPIAALIVVAGLPDAALAQIAPTPTSIVVHTPELISSPGSNAVLYAQVLDQFARPMAGQTLQFDIRGSGDNNYQNVMTRYGGPSGGGGLISMVYTRYFDSEDIILIHPPAGAAGYVSGVQTTAAAIVTFSTSATPVATVGEPAQRVYVTNENSQPLAAYETARFQVNVFDASNHPVNGTLVTFKAQGTNFATRQAYTDWNGQATFDYMGISGGADIVTATAAAAGPGGTVQSWTPNDQQDCRPICETATTVTFDDAYLSGPDPGCGYVGFYATDVGNQRVQGNPDYSARAVTAGVATPQEYSGYLSGGAASFYYCPPAAVVVDPVEVTFTATVGVATGAAVRSWDPDQPSTDPCPASGPHQAGFAAVCAAMGTGDSPVPATSGSAMTYTPDPLAVAEKLSAYALNYETTYAAAVDIPDLEDFTQAGALDTYYGYLPGVPFHVQETRYWCGPAATQQILDYTGNHPSQATLAGDLGTTTRGTAFPEVADVVNQRRPNNPISQGGVWIRSDVTKQGDIIGHLRWGSDHNQPGAFHVMLLKEHFPYYEFNHTGHIMTSAGWAHVGENKYRGGYVDPYDEDDPNVGVDGGANTGGFHTLNIWRLYAATKDNTVSAPGGDMIW